jgi:Subtilase family/Secretion system C-terminal sorting domain
MKHSTLKLMTIKVLTLLIIALPFFGLSQTNYDISFQNQVISIPQNISTIDLNIDLNSSKYGEDLYVWMQFNQVPSQSAQNTVKDNGVELINYISNFTYLARISANISKTLLIENGVRGIIPISAQMKISENLRKGDINPWALEGNLAKLTVIVHENILIDDVISQLRNDGVQIINHYRGYPLLEVIVPVNHIMSLGEYSFVKYIEEITPPSIKDDARGRSLHRSSSLDTQTPTGLDYTGLNIGVLVRDDGIVGPHIDFQGRIDNSTATGTGQTHGDGVGGIMAGAGNLDPTMRGMAAGANVFVSNYAANFLDAATTTRITNGTVQITNSSYSNGCNDGYTSTAVTVDNQTITNPTVLHVFSAGNSGTSNCSYGAGSGWGNITGGHKQGKNVIATANLYFDGTLANSSSRGPAHDGRIKPDISANGQDQLSTDEGNTYLTFGGTSGAAPGIAGIAAQLYQVYQEANGGVLPPSALIKATLLNTANDAGNVGPDFKFGWGIVNALRAAKLLEDARYFTSSVSQGNANNHSIIVPAGTKQVKFMLYWMDPAATNGATTALINDLDLVVNDPTAGTYLPWILNSTPNATSLNLPATNGADHLNNMEQVLINNPAAGSYTINVSGFSVPMGPQNYFIVYEIISDEITVTYPNRGEHFVPGETESVHWDAPQSTGSFLLEYSVDNGTSWNNIATVASTLRTYGWAVPNSITGSALFRVTRGGVSDVSDANFSIATQVTGQTITQVCPTTVTFSWNAVPNATSYDVYILGTQYMEVIGNSATTTYTHTITNPNTPIWYAIVAKNSTLGWESRRTIASYYAGGILNCANPIDAAVVSIVNNGNDFSPLCSPSGDFPAIQLLNGGSNSISNIGVSYQLSGQAPVNEIYTGTLSPGQQVLFTFSTPLLVNVTGNYSLTVTATVAGDGNPSNDSQVLNFIAQTTGTATPFTESFETAGFLPAGWLLDNPDNDETWVEGNSIIGSSGTATTTAFINNYSYNAPGEEDYFETNAYAIAGGMATLRFDLAKRQYSTSLSDSLKVMISADCGTTWTTIYAKGGTTLATGGSSTNDWSPSAANDWRNELVDISTYLGQNVIFRFINVNGYGNNTYIDNINVSSDLSVSELNQVQFDLFPNPTNGAVQIVVSDNLMEDAEMILTNELGQRLRAITKKEFTGNTTSLDLSNYERGVYFVTIVNDSVVTTKRIVKN